MKLNVLFFYNKKIECYTQPIFDDHEPEVAAEQLARSLKLEKDVSKVTPYKNLSLFRFGVFDDQTGKLELLAKPVLLLDCEAVCKERPDYVESEPITRSK